MAIYDDALKAYIPIEIAVTESNPARYYSSVNYTISLNGEITNYKSDSKVDQENPYDPLFSSFDRLYSLPLQTFIQSGVTGVRIGEKERFFSIANGFSRSSIINVNGAASNSNKELNGNFVPTDDIINGRPSYVNSSIVFPAFITYSNDPSGWVISQSNIPVRIPGQPFKPVKPRQPTPLYFLAGTGLPVGSGWVVTGVVGESGNLPVPKTTQQELEGFFKIATSVKSLDKNKIYARQLGSTGILTGETSGSLPSGFNWVTYPHSYNVESYPAFRYPVSLTFGNDASGLKDLLIVSTGRSSKHIVYVSPHNIEQFQGFWSEQSGSLRVPKTGIDGRVLSTRPLWVLKSGNLISITSEFKSFTGLKFEMVSGIGSSGVATYLYNYEVARLKQETPLNQTAFYKLYEPVYPKNTLETGTWDGIIPSGVPFSIETVRTKNSELSTPKIEVHVHQTFTNINGYVSGVLPSGSGHYQFIRPFNYERFAGVGIFEGYANKNSPVSSNSANYISESSAKKQAKSKLRGYLWEKGLTVDNHKVKQIVKLFGTQVTASGVNGQSTRSISEPRKRYCLPYHNPSDPLSCSYTGTARGAFGIPTSAGLRTIDQHSNVLPNFIDEEGNVIRFVPILEQ